MEFSVPRREQATAPLSAGSSLNMPFQLLDVTSVVSADTAFPFLPSLLEALPTARTILSLPFSASLDRRAQVSRAEPCVMSH